MNLFDKAETRNSKYIEFSVGSNTEVSKTYDSVDIFNLALKLIDQKCNTKANEVEHFSDQTKEAKLFELVYESCVLGVAQEYHVSMRKDFYYDDHYHTTFVTQEFLDLLVLEIAHKIVFILYEDEQAERTFLNKSQEMLVGEYEKYRSF